MFNDIKKGDKIALIRTAGIPQWNTILFAKTFVIHLEVERITKTQFIAGGVRFKKETGREIKSGYGGEHAKKATGIHQKYDRKYDLSLDQSCEHSKYKLEAEKASRKIKSARGLFDMENCKSIEDIDDAHNLLMKLAQIAPVK